MILNVPPPPKKKSYVLDTVIVCLVFHDGVGWEIKDPLQCVPDS